MTQQLKTLKDLNWANVEPQRTQLKQEAIKWIKTIKTENITLSNGLPITAQGNEKYYLESKNKKMLIFWIKLFFNITDEDLK